MVEDTINPEFKYAYFGLRNESGFITAFQPFFLVDQDILLGAHPHLKSVVQSIRRFWPRFIVMRTLMVGCVAGEGHIDDGEEYERRRHMECLAGTLTEHARTLKAGLIVLKEFPAQYRLMLRCFLSHGFVRVPSLPMTGLNIEYESFADYTKQALKSATRAKLRRKFRASETGAPIVMEVVTDVSAVVDEFYPLYLEVYRRSKLRFDKLTKAYFIGLGARMPDKVRFFLWRLNGRIVAFTLCMLEGESLYAEYIGLDYSVALDRHLYHCAVRDMIDWGIAHGFKYFRAGALNYDPKLQMRHRLDPLDLYVRHRSPAINAILKRFLPLLDPTRQYPILRKFPNYDELGVA